MTSLRASYPVLRDRFTTFVRLPFGVDDYYNEAVGIMQANGYMFCVDEWGLHASEDGVNFLPIAELMGDKISAVAYGNDKYVFVGEGIWTSDGPDEYFNWNLQVQTPASSVFFMGVGFDGTAFVACCEGMTEMGNKPIFNRALATDVTTWSEIEGASLASWTEGAYIWKVKAYGGRFVAVGGAQGEYLPTDYRTTDVMQYSDDSGATWTNVTPPGTQPQPEDTESVGYTELEHVGDRWLALTSEETEEGVPSPRLAQSLDGASWEAIEDRFVTPLFMNQQPEPAERHNRSALMNDNGRIVCLLPSMEMQIGKMGSTGPTDFERVPLARFQDSEKGMLLFKGNYYLLIEISGSMEATPAYAVAFTPRVPVVE